jgi:hypothetical protein
MLSDIHTQHVSCMSARFSARRLFGWGSSCWSCAKVVQRLFQPLLDAMPLLGECLRRKATGAFPAVLRVSGLHR